MFDNELEQIQNGIKKEQEYHKRALDDIEKRKIREKDRHNSAMQNLNSKKQQLQNKKQNNENYNKIVDLNKEIEKALKELDNGNVDDEFEAEKDEK